MSNYRFPEQTLVTPEQPYSEGLLRDLLTTAFSVSSPFTGYLRFGSANAVSYLFFFNGSPYAAGRYSGGKPVSYTITQLGDQLAGSGDTTLALCATDPVLLKCMLLFMQEEPAVKAPTTLIDIEYIVRQIGDAGANAMITLCRDDRFNFFFFREGKGALAHYADIDFARPDGMSVDEEMLLYAFQPDTRVQAYVFRDMITVPAEDASALDLQSLLALVCGVQQAETISPPPREPASDARPASKPRLPRVELTVEEGPQLGERFTVTLPCSIGRKNCDLILNDSMISRRHAELKIIDGRLYIEDQGSTNGTKVNNETVTQRRLVPNDRIAIGETTLRITPAST